MSPQERTLRSLFLVVAMGLSATLFANGAVILLVARAMPLVPGVPELWDAEREPPPARGAEALLEGGLFLQPEPPPPPPAAGGPCAGSLRLVGSMLTPERQMIPFASIRGPDGRALLYQPGMVVEGHRLMRIERDRVVLAQTTEGPEEGARTCELHLFDEEEEAAPPPEGGTPRGGVEVLGENRYRVDRGLLRSWLGSSLGAARAIPHRIGTPEAGVRLYGLRGGTPLAQLGLRNGDVLQRVNGRSVLELRPDELATLARRSRFRLSILRRGQPIELRYELTGALPSEAEIRHHLDL